MFSNHSAESLPAVIVYTKGTSLTDLATDISTVPVSQADCSGSMDTYIEKLCT